MTEKRFKFRQFDVDIANINEIALYEIDNNPSDDLDESNLFYVYSTTNANVQQIVDKLNSQEEQLKSLTKENRLLKITYAKCRDCKYADDYVPNYAYPYLIPKCKLNIKEIDYDTNACEDFEIIGRNSR